MAHLLTDEMLRQIMPNAPKSKRLASLPILNQVMVDYDINNERRAAAWLATVAVESGELKYQQELASGSAYEGRRDLGNTQPGDGKKYKGHGRIQITGRANHAAYTNYLKGRGHLAFVNFITEPERLAEEPYATDSAGWFWAVYKDLNELADQRNFLRTQTAVNGRNKNGLPNHWTERKGYYERALRNLPDDFLLEGASAVEDATPADLDEPDVDEVDDATMRSEARSSLGMDSEAVTKNEIKPEPLTEKEKEDSPIKVVSNNPPTVELKSTGVSLWTKIQSTYPAVATALGGVGLKLGGVQFSTAGVIAFCCVLVIGMITGAILYERGKAREQERLRWSQQNLATNTTANVIVGASAS